MISENGHLYRSPENDIQKSIISSKNARETKPMALIKMSENPNKTGHMNRSYHVTWNSLQKLGEMEPTFS